MTFYKINQGQLPKNSIVNYVGICDLQTILRGDIKNIF